MEVNHALRPEMISFASILGKSEEAPPASFRKWSTWRDQGPVSPLHQYINSSRFTPISEFHPFSSLHHTRLIDRAESPPPLQILQIPSYVLWPFYVLHMYTMPNAKDVKVFNFFYAAWYMLLNRSYYNFPKSSLGCFSAGIPSHKSVL